MGFDLEEKEPAPAATGTSPKDIKSQFNSITEIEKCQEQIKHTVQELYSAHNYLEMLKITLQGGI